MNNRHIYRKNEQNDYYILKFGGQIKKFVRIMKMIELSFKLYLQNY